jgi:hypothetical protein
MDGWLVFSIVVAVLVIVSGGLLAVLLSVPDDEGVPAPHLTSKQQARLRRETLARIAARRNA